jgi:hypothetical protein
MVDISSMESSMKEFNLLDGDTKEFQRASPSIEGGV